MTPALKEALIEELKLKLLREASNLIKLSKFLLLGEA
jgi:hypothetical protein